MKSEPLTPERRWEIRKRLDEVKRAFPYSFGAHGYLIRCSGSEILALLDALEEAEARIAELEAEAKGKEGA